MGSQSDGTLCILALDAADVRLARRWECDNLLLENHAPLETIGSEGDRGKVPYTLDVWPAVATGQYPSEWPESRNESEWQNPALRLASRVTQYLPGTWRELLGSPFKASGAELKTPVQELPNLFDANHGVTKGWPLLDECPRLAEAWTLIEQANNGTIDSIEFRDRLMNNMHEATEWLAKQPEKGIPVAGTHVHILDAAGHAYADSEARLEPFYQAVNAAVGRLRNQVERLVILSDHGMQVSCLDDSNPGVHSWDALFATTEAGELPDSVVDVRQWVEERITTEAERARMAAPEEDLKDLGYFE